MKCSACGKECFTISGVDIKKYSMITKAVSDCCGADMIYSASECNWHNNIMQGNNHSGVHTSAVTDHPAHYTSGEIECIDAIRSALTPEEFRGYCKGNIIKYIWREKLKGGNEDIKKAIKYAEWVK